MYKPVVVMPYPRGPNTIGFSHVHNTTVNETHSKERKKQTFSFGCMLAFAQAGSVPVHALITIEKKTKQVLPLFIRS